MKEKKNKLITYFLILLYVASYYLWITLFKSDGRTFITVSSIFQTAPSLIVSSVLFKLYTSKRYEKDSFWLIMLLGIVINLIGQMVRNYYEIILKVNAPSPGLPDLFWNIAALFYLVALFYKFHNRIKNKSILTLAIDVMTTTCIAIAIAWVYMIHPFATNINSLSFINLLSHIAYPTIDLVLLCGTISLYASLEKDDIEKRYISKVIISFSILLISNLIYTYTYTTGQYRTGNLVDPLWSLYMLLILASVLEYKNTPLKKEEMLSAKRNKGVFLLGTNLSAVILFTFMIYKQDLVVWICSVLSIILINIRQILMHLQNKGLIKELSNLNENLEAKVKERTEELYKMAYIDFLTRLPNRRALELKISEILKKQDNSKYLGALIILDLDKFKSINDTFGHVLGDLLLKSVGEKLQGLKNKDMNIFRQGGDEFAITLESLNSKEEIYKIVKKF